MKTRPDYYGVEFDWFATDSTGFVAWMMSAGYGPIPDEVFQQLDKRRAIEEHLARLSGYSTKAPWPRMMWSLSTAGLFVYDWKHWKGPYRRIGFPLLPKRVHKFALPPDLRSALVTLPKHFWTSFCLRPELLLPCTRERAKPE
jgi:hypothetical protein